MNLSESRRKIFHKLMNGAGVNGLKQSSTIAPRPLDKPIPLSFQQLQVWLHGQAAELPFYNENITFYHSGPLDPTVLAQSLCELVRRHEIYRTTFDIWNGESVQIVNPAPAVFPLEVADLRDLPKPKCLAEAIRLATTNARRSFDLRTGPLLRALLVSIDDEDYRLYMTFHQLVFDGVTAHRVFLPELAALYEAFSCGRTSALPEPSIQYGDFAYWQRSRPMPEIWSEHEAFWRSQLSGELPLLNLPTDHPRPSIETHRGETLPLTFPSELAESLRTFSRSEGASLYVILLAAFATLFERYTGQEDIIVGGLSAGRNRTETESLAGFFVNALALRIDLSGNPTFRELLARVRSVVLDALSHEELPFAEVVKQIQQRPDSTRHPLFQVMFSQQPRNSESPKGWDWVIEEVSNGGSKMDLFVIADCSHGIRASVTYNPDLFESSSIVRMVGHWQTLMASAVTNPDLTIRELSILSSAELGEVLSDWNDTFADYPKETCLHQLVEAQAARTPEAIAVKFGARQLSYRQLNARANQLARHLRKLGVGPDALVGISIERSLDMVIALLGVLKAGGAYVPLDSTYPKDRLSFMVEDSGLKVLVTEESLVQIWAGHRVEIVLIDREWDEMRQYDTENLVNTVEPTNLVYVIYTSGSTGRPKGVQLCHRNLVNLLTSMSCRPGLTSTDSFLAITTISFDIAALELYLPLVTGACCVIASREAAADVTELRNLLQEHDITVMQATPSTWRLLVDSGWTGKADLRILCGGEAMSRDLAHELLARSGEVWNMYGPTETCVWSAIYPVTSARPILIGRPILNTQMYILDRNLQPLPIGIPGELYIAGDGLARGYLNRPELDAERFISHSFGHGSSVRLYRTGDRARYHEDGNIECLGRIDTQVKLRGFRIELGEVESVLREHPAVRETCVMVREDLPTDARLTAYVITNEETRLDDIRRFLKEKLPKYMIPRLVALNRFPLTPNGKLDRRALPSLEESALMEDITFDEVLDPLEQVLADIWTDALNVDHVSLYDNFFDLGGHSLLATQVVARIQKVFGVSLKQRELAFQTLGQIAASCRERVCFGATV
jgi:amino acid adenylation domain-containing protein